MGMFASRPTQSATSANMSIPELQMGSEMIADGKIVNKEDRTIACVKVAVDLVWYETAQMAAAPAPPRHASLSGLHSFSESFFSLSHSFFLFLSLFICSLCLPAS